MGQPNAMSSYGLNVSNTFYPRVSHVGLRPDADALQPEGTAKPTVEKDQTTRRVIGHPSQTLPRSGSVQF